MLRGQSNLIASVLMIGAVLSLGALLVGIFASYYVPIKVVADRDFLVSRADSFTVIGSGLSFGNTYIIPISRFYVRGAVYVCVVGVRLGSYGWRRLLYGLDYDVGVINVSSVGLVAVNGSGGWVSPQSFGVVADRVMVKDVRLSETAFGALSNKFGFDAFVTLHKLTLLPRETYLLRIRLLKDPSELGVDELMVVFLIQFPTDGRYYMFHAVYLHLT